MAERPPGDGQGRQGGRSLIPQMELIMIQHFRSTEGRMDVAHELEKASTLFLDLDYVVQLLHAGEFKTAFEYLLPFLKAADEERPHFHDNTNRIKSAILKHWILELFVTKQRNAALDPLDLFAFHIGETDLYRQLDDVIRRRRLLKDIVGLGEPWSQPLKPSAAQLSQTVQNEIIQHECLRQRLQMPEMQVKFDRMGQPTSRLRQLMVKAVSALYQSTPESIFVDPPVSTALVMDAASAQPNHNGVHHQSATASTPLSSSSSGISTTQIQSPQPNRKRPAEEMTNPSAKLEPPIKKQKATESSSSLIHSAKAFINPPSHLARTLSSAGDVKSLHFHPTKHNILLICSQQGRNGLVFVVDVATGSVLSELKRPKPILKALFSPDGTFIGCDQGVVFELFPLDASMKFGDPTHMQTEGWNTLAWDFMRHTKQTFIFMALKRPGQNEVRGKLFTFAGTPRADINVPLNFDVAAYISSSLHTDPGGSLVVITIGQQSQHSNKVSPICIAFDYDNFVKEPIIVQPGEPLPQHYDGAMIDGDSERLYLLGDKFYQNHVEKHVMETPGGQQGNYSPGQPRGCLSSSGDVVAIPEGNRILFYRVPWIDGQLPQSVVVESTTSVVKTAFSKDGSFFAASTPEGHIKVLSRAIGDRNSVSTLEREPATNSVPPTPLPSISSSVFKRTENPHITLVEQLRTWFDTKHNQRSLFALGKSGSLVRLFDPPINDSGMTVIRCDGLRDSNNGRRPFSFVVTPGARYIGLVAPVGVFLITHDGTMHDPEPNPRYLAPKSATVTAFDLHPVDANFRAMATSTGAIQLDKKANTTTYPLFSGPISHLRFLDVRKSPKLASLPGLCSVVATSGSELTMLHLSITFEDKLVGKWEKMPEGQVRVYAAEKISGIDCFGHYTVVWSGSKMQIFDSVTATMHPPWTSTKGSITCACFVNQKFVIGATDTGDMFILSVLDQQIPQLVSYIKTSFAPAYATAVSLWEDNIVAVGLSNGNIARLKIDFKFN